MLPCGKPLYISHAGAGGGIDNSLHALGRGCILPFTVCIVTLCITLLLMYVVVVAVHSSHAPKQLYTGAAVTAYECHGLITVF
jgi:hypothetical protein